MYKLKLPTRSNLLNVLIETPEWFKKKGKWVWSTIQLYIYYISTGNKWLSTDWSRLASIFFYWSFSSKVRGWNVLWGLHLEVNRVLLPDFTLLVQSRWSHIAAENVLEAVNIFPIMFVSFSSTISEWIYNNNVNNS